MKAARANRDLVRGIKVHAEVGGFTRWGDEVMRKAAEIGREAELPVYIHFGQLWALPDGSNGVDPDAILPAMRRSSCGRATSSRIPSRAIPAASSTRHGKLHPDRARGARRAG